MAPMEFLGMDFSCVFGSLSNGKFPEKDCMLPLISKLLGYAIVAASTTVKLPQIMKIIQHKSVRGLSVVAFEMEVVGYTIALAYCLHNGLPFSAYGELAFLLLQGIVSSKLSLLLGVLVVQEPCPLSEVLRRTYYFSIILVATIYYFSQPVGNSTWIRALLYCGLAPTILAGKIHPLLFEALYASQHAIFFFARVPQIWKNVKNKSTGELSFITSFMNFLGSIVRVFTSLQEKAPTSVVMGSVLGILTNGAILSQIILYKKPEEMTTKKGKKAE
ncbi:Cystinosin/ERS1p repeat-containing protein [Cynara cardunculus var. scolymus]|uniref:Mannose-P-dolichol utilization defect 1 protein homolog n=1 Tax=Cynara cardunculus var. scolymus TaxID=59895 RepID=A0A118JYB3_CYNCS|nr:Cystinosin/ERS1p repeat-containing protein [Cynara cardunculus var. scolymus]